MKINNIGNIIFKKDTKDKVEKTIIELLECEKIDYHKGIDSDYLFIKIDIWNQIDLITDDECIEMKKIIKEGLRNG